MGALNRNTLSFVQSSGLSPMDEVMTSAPTHAENPRLGDLSLSHGPAWTAPVLTSPSIASVPQEGTVSAPAELPARSTVHVCSGGACNHAAAPKGMVYSAAATGDTDLLARALCHRRTLLRRRIIIPSTEEADSVRLVLARSTLSVQSHVPSCQDGETALNAAARGGHVDAAKLLIDAGAKVFTKTRVGRVGCGSRRTTGS